MLLEWNPFIHRGLPLLDFDHVSEKSRMASFQGNEWRAPEPCFHGSWFPGFYQYCALHIHFTPCPYRWSFHNHKVSAGHRCPLFHFPTEKRMFVCFSILQPFHPGISLESLYSGATCNINDCVFRVQMAKRWTTPVGKFEERGDSAQWCGPGVKRTK